MGVPRSIDSERSARPYSGFRQMVRRNGLGSSLGFCEERTRSSALVNARYSIGQARRCRFFETKHTLLRLARCSGTMSLCGHSSEIDHLHPGSARCSRTRVCSSSGSDSNMLALQPPNFVEMLVSVQSCEAGQVVGVGGAVLQRVLWSLQAMVLIGKLRSTSKLNKTRPASDVP